MKGGKINFGSSTSPKAEDQKKEGFSKSLDLDMQNAFQTAMRNKLVASHKLISNEPLSEVERMLE